MKATEQNFLWCCLLCYARLWYCSLCCTKWFRLLWYTMWFLPFKSVNEILKCDHSNDSYWAVISVVLFTMLCLPVVLFTMLCSPVVLLTMLCSPVVLFIILCSPVVLFTMLCLPVVLFIMLYKVVLSFESGDEILPCDHSKKTLQHFLCMALSIFHDFTRWN